MKKSYIKNASLSVHLQIDVAWTIDKGLSQKKISSSFYTKEIMKLPEVRKLGDLEWSRRK